jgi:cation diffusion facilitator family transporter
MTDVSRPTPSPLPLDRSTLIRRASIIALIGNAILAAMKITTGVLAGSLAVLGDGIDSSTDVVIAIMTLVVSKIATRPADSGHPWGHGRAEAVATAALSFILFFAGGQLVLSGGGNLLRGELPRIPSPIALAVTLFSMAGKLVLAWTQFRYSKLAGSAMLKANGKNMASDVLISAAVLVGLFLAIVVRIPLADPIAAILVGLWVIKNAFGIFREANLELMDGNADTSLYGLVFDAVRAVPGAGNPHRARMRRIAGSWDIDLDIEVDGDMTVRASHEVAGAVEREIRKRMENVYDIVVHVEPAGASGSEAHEGGEGFGLDESQIEKR